MKTGKGPFGIISMALDTFNLKMLVGGWIIHEDNRIYMGDTKFVSVVAVHILQLQSMIIIHRRTFLFHFSVLCVLA